MVESRSANFGIKNPVNKSAVRRSYNETKERKEVVTSGKHGKTTSVEIVQSRLRIPVNRITGERERVKGRGHPSSHHLFALIAGHICSEPGLCSPLLGGIAWKSSVFPRPTLSALVSPPPTLTNKVSQ